MRIHLTCRRPTRSLVLALHAARTLLSRAGHAVCVTWPEDCTSGEEATRSGARPGDLERADVIVSFCPPDSREMPSDVVAASRNGKCVMRLVHGRADLACQAPGDGVPDTSLEHLCESVAEVFASAVA